jgi:hypothetical protein
MMMIFWLFGRPRNKGVYADLRWLTADVAIIRVYDWGKGFESKDPYRFVVTAHFTESHQGCTLMGVIRRPTQSEAKAIARAIQATGCKSASWERHNGGKTRKVTFQPKHLKR